MPEPQALEISDDADILRLPGRQMLDIGLVRNLSRPSNACGLSRTAAHLGCMAAGAGLVWLAQATWWFVPAMALHGATLVTCRAGPGPRAGKRAAHGRRV